MTVLTQALRRLDQQAPGIAARRGASAVPLGATLQVLVEPPTPTEADHTGQREPFPSHADDDFVDADCFQEGLVDEIYQEEGAAPIPAQTVPPAPGELLHACDLTTHSDQGLALAAGLAVKARRDDSDSVAVVAIAARTTPADSETTPHGARFTETNDPGLYAGRLILDDSRTACRELLVLIDSCRRRFLRTVLVVDSADDAALRLVVPRADDTVMLATLGDTPEPALLRAESRIRLLVSRARPRVVMAA